MTSALVGLLGTKRTMPQYSIALGETIARVEKRHHFSIRLLLSLVLIAGGDLLTLASSGQVVPAFKDTSLPSQVTGTLQYTMSDYAVVTGVNKESQVRLVGGATEFTDRRFRPFGIVGRASYQSSTLVGQKLLTSEAGLEYYQRVNRWAPFAQVMVGGAHTSSSGYQYLYSSSKIGLAATAAAGLDYHTHGRWGIRILEVEADHYSFGVSGNTSFYWSIGAGAFYSLGSI